MKEIIKLIMPTLDYEHQVMAYKEAFIKSGENLAGCGSLRDKQVYQDWLDDLLILRTKVIDLRVPSTTYLAIRISDDKLVGNCDLRHHINHPILALWGGHIGYSVSTLERNKGYGTETLRLILLKAKSIGLKSVLVTCNEENIASNKIIKNNGGKYTSTVEVEDEKINKYLISLA
ncbi:MAG TPA: GNAT family N-acetyltransferase [Acholeplasma sp.]|nr:GNAT family N-acetyltransferase [Acholeplasma sp.]